MARYDRTSLKRKRGKGPLALSTRLGRQHARVMARTKLGSGERFRSMVNLLRRKKGVRNPRAVAAAIMWKKYGRKGGARLIKMGKRKAK